MEAFPFTDAEWDPLRDLADPILNASLANDDALAASLRLNLLELLAGLRERHGDHPVLLETMADYTEAAADRVPLYRRAVEIAELHGLPTLSIRRPLPKCGYTTSATRWQRLMNCTRAGAKCLTVVRWSEGNGRHCSRMRQSRRTLPSGPQCSGGRWRSPRHTASRRCASGCSLSGSCWMKSNRRGRGESCVHARMRCPAATKKTEHFGRNCARRQAKPNQALHLTRPAPAPFQTCSPRMRAGQVSLVVMRRRLRRHEVA